MGRRWVVATDVTVILWRPPCGEREGDATMRWAWARSADEEGVTTLVDSGVDSQRVIDRGGGRGWPW